MEILSTVSFQWQGHVDQVARQDCLLQRDHEGGAHLGPGLQTAPGEEPFPILLLLGKSF